MKLHTHLILTMLICSLTGAVNAYDSSRELLIRDRLQERVKVGTPVLLTSGDKEFLVIHTEQMTSEPLGVVLLLHSLGAHPDWPIVISPLRKSLPQRGWSTVSIQLPVLPPEDSISDYGETLNEAHRRIDSTLAWLAEQKLEPVVIIGYSFGAATGFQYAARNGTGKPALIGMAGISPLAQPFLRPKLKLMDEIENIKIPVLDIHGSRDYPEIIDQAPDRRLAGRKGDNPWYQQIEVEGADHNYSGLTTVLSKRISGWLKKLIADYRVQQDNVSETTEPAAGAAATQ
ncbi:MAG: alpha/beta hydrolase family protein [Thiotrichales bacterium]|nr:alpha/beta hydrolase family protein [Thiotrichales bacterium]